MEEARVCIFMPYVTEGRKGGSACMYIYAVICSGSTKMEEARVCTFMSYVAEARKLGSASMSYVA